MDSSTLIGTINISVTSGGKSRGTFNIPVYMEKRRCLCTYKE